MPAPLILAIAALGGYFLGSSRATVGRPSMQLGYPMEDSESMRKALERYANAMAANNADWFRANPDAPDCVTRAGVGYIAPPNCKGNPSCQAVRDAPGLLSAKVGTCIDFAAYDAGHHLAAGSNARVVLYHVEVDGVVQEFQYHAVVQGPQGVEDPAAEVQAKAGGCGCGE